MKALVVVTLVIVQIFLQGDRVVFATSSTDSSTDSTLPASITTASSSANPTAGTTPPGATTTKAKPTSVSPTASTPPAGKLDGACPATSNCTDAHTTCESSVCKCDTGYVPNAGVCKIKAGNSTSVHCTAGSGAGDCVENAACVADTYCECNNGYDQQSDGSCKGKSGATIVTMSWVLLLASALHSLTYLA